MRSIVLLIAAVSIASPLAAKSSNSVKGYVKKDGTYVAPHYRTNPDSSTTNNWSSQPNVNPYTGQPGKVDPYKPKEWKPYKPKD